MRATDQMMELFASRMAEAPAEKRLDLLHGIDNLHVMLFVSWIVMEAHDHKDHGKECEFAEGMKGIAETYLETFTASVMGSIEATCAVNGMVFAPDPNKELRDEILREGST